MRRDMHQIQAIRSTWWKWLTVLLAALIAAPSMADIQVDVSVSPDPARPGETLELEITVTNDGPFQLNDVSVQMEWPVNVASMDDSLVEGGCPGISCESGEVLTLPTISALAAGNGRSFSVPARVAGGVADGTIITFDVEVFDNDALQATATTDLAVLASRKIELAMVEDRDPATPEGLITYTLTYGVLPDIPGGGSAGAMLEFTLPAGTTFVSASGTGTFDSGAVVWGLGALIAGSSGEQTVTAQVNNDVPVGTILRAEAAYSDASSNAVAFETATRVQTEMPLELRIIASPDPVRPNETMEVELIVTNKGLFQRSGILLRLEVPDHLASLDESLIDGGCSGISCETRERVFIDIGTLDPDESRSYSMPWVVSTATASGTVFTLAGDLTDSTGDMRESGTSVAVTSARFLELAMVEDRDPAAPGDLITYTLTYGVRPDVPGGGIVGPVVRFPVPTGTTFVSATGNGTLNGDVVEWFFASLDGGSTGEQQVTVQVDDTTNIGSILFSEAMFSDSSRIVRYQTATRVQEDVPLELRIIASPDPAIPGEVLDVELTVANADAFPRSGILLRLEVPDHLASLDESLIDGGCSGISCEIRERVFIDIGNLAPGESRTYSMPWIVSTATATGTVFTLAGDVADSTGEMRESGANVAVALNANDRTLDLAVYESEDQVLPGQNIDYTITFGTFFGAGGSPDGTLRFFPPVGTQVASINRGGVLVDGAVEWPIGDLNPGEGGERSVTVQLDPDVTAGAILYARAEFNDTLGNEVRFEESTSVVDDTPLDVTLTVNPNPAAPGRQLNVSLSVANDGTLNRDGIWLWFEYPAGLNSLSDSAFAGDCSGISCEARERAWFNVGTLAPGETASFTMPPVVRSDVLEGVVLNMNAWAFDSTGFRAGAGDAILIAPCPGNTNGDGIVNLADLLNVLSNWGSDGSSGGDSNGDGTVNLADLLEVLSNWGTDCL